MISFSYNTAFVLDSENSVVNWLSEAISLEKHVLGDILYVFCNDEYLHRLNVDFLNHDTYTDVISFDYKVGKILHGEIYISLDRVKENAQDYSQSFNEELRRVMIHGILHYCGYNDKTSEDIACMREKEDEYLNRYLSFN